MLNEIQCAFAELKELQIELADLKDRQKEQHRILEKLGIPRQVATLAMKMEACEANERRAWDAALAIARAELGVPVQLEMDMDDAVATADMAAPHVRPMADAAGAH